MFRTQNYFEEMEDDVNKISCEPEEEVARKPEKKKSRFKQTGRGLKPAT